MVDSSERVIYSNHHRIDRNVSTLLIKNTAYITLKPSNKAYTITGICQWFWILACHETLPSTFKLKLFLAHLGHGGNWDSCLPSSMQLFTCFSLLFPTAQHEVWTPNLLSSLLAVPMLWSLPSLQLSYPGFLFSLLIQSIF